jgi:thymidine phosphorylase
MNYLSRLTKLLDQKQDGKALQSADYDLLMNAYLRQGFPRQQMAALLKAICIHRSTPEEVTALTYAMLGTGRELAFPEDSRPLVDRHSTGGVGDKVSLIVTPLLAALGFRVPNITASGAGYTAGTLEKLAAVPGVRLEFTVSEIIDIVQRHGCIICAPTDELVPADRALFKLRRETGTVACPPLIAASILSKKFAESLSALVLDIKFGVGSIVGNYAEAIALMNMMRSVCRQRQLRNGCLITDMSRPIGLSIGPWLEVCEATRFLTETADPDLMEIVTLTAGMVLLLTGRETELPQAAAAVRRELGSGRPLTRWRQMLTAQGADLDKFDEMMDEDTSLGPATTEVFAPEEGYVSGCDARILGQVVSELSDPTYRGPAGSAFCGIDRIVKEGRVVVGQSLGRIHAPSAALAQQASLRALQAWSFCAEPHPNGPRVVSCFNYSGDLK